jgi:hypothetical protein
LLKRRFGIKKSIQLQWDFLFCRPSRAVWLVESRFCHPYGAVLPVEREKGIQLQWDFGFLHTAAAKCLFLRFEFQHFSLESLKFKPQKQAFGCSCMKKPKIPLQLYALFTFDRQNRPIGVTKPTFDKPNCSRGSTKQKIPLQLYALFDAKTTF